MKIHVNMPFCFRKDFRGAKCLQIEALDPTSDLMMPMRPKQHPLLTLFKGLSFIKLPNVPSQSFEPVISCHHPVINFNCSIVPFNRSTSNCQDKTPLPLSEPNFPITLNTDSDSILEPVCRLVPSFSSISPAPLP